MDSRYDGRVDGWTGGVDHQGGEAAEVDHRGGEAAEVDWGKQPRWWVHQVHQGLKRPKGAAEVMRWIGGAAEVMRWIGRGGRGG